MRLTISQKSTNRRAMKLVSEMEERVGAIIEHFPEAMAHKVMRDVAAAAPRDIERYAKLMAVRRFELTDIASAVGIVVPGYAAIHTLKEHEAGRVILYVQPKVGQGGLVDPGAVVLWKRNPWTMDTLPYEPEVAKAKIVSRRVSTRSVSVVQRNRQTDRPQVTRELLALGEAVQRSHGVLLNRRVTRDLAFEVLRREFGLGDAPHVSHWRPALHRARTVFAKEILKMSLRWLAVPSEGRWKRPLKAKPGKVSDVRKVQGFQAYLRSE